LAADRLAWGNRRGAPGHEAAQPRLEALLASFDEQIRAIEADIKTLVQACQPVA
jgi:hypothetical protein